MKYNISVQPTTKSHLPDTDFNNIPFGKTFSDHMFIADYNGKEWINPRIVPFGYIPMHPGNLGIHYGQSIFEGMKASKTIDGTPCLFRPEMHIERINASAARMCMPAFPEDLFFEALEMLLEIDSEWIPDKEGSALYIRPLMYATDEALGVRASTNYSMVIMSGPVGPYYTKPLKIWAETKYIRAAPGGIGEAKTAGNYAASLLPARIAAEHGYDQVMWLDAHEFKYIQEAGTMNLMFVIDGKLITPATEGTILKGITRDTILKIADAKGIPYEERPISIDELVVAYEAGKLEEAFGSGTAAIIAQIAEITYKDKTIKLPPIEDQKLGLFFKNEINGLRSGAIADTYGWLKPIRVPVV